MRQLLIFAILLLSSALVYGQDDLASGLQQHSWAVFLQPAAAQPNKTDIVFIDLLSGDVNRVSVQGERFSLVADAVIYLDTLERQVKLAQPDGLIRDHPFIRLAADEQGVDWTVSQDQQRIAWTISRELEADQLISKIWLANAAGTEVRELLTYGPREGIALLPIAFSQNSSELYLEVFVTGSDELQLYRARGGLLALDFSAEEVRLRSLPGDPPCFCAVAFGTDIILRLPQNKEANGIDVAVYPLDGSPARLIPALPSDNYNQAGNLLLSPDGAFAIYSLSQVSGFHTAQQEIQTVLALVDLQNARQSILNIPTAGLARPISWTEDNSAVLFTTDTDSGTWKISLESGDLLKIADGEYLGMLSNS